MNGASDSSSRRSAALVLCVLLAVFAALHAYWAVGGSWGLETAVGPFTSRPASGPIWGMAVVLLLFAFAALIVSRAPTGAAPLAAHIALGVLSLGAAAVGCLNFVMGTRAAERFGIGPFAVMIALLAGYAASGRRRARAARLGSG
jgi:hypothetical protein